MKTALINSISLAFVTLATCALQGRTVTLTVNNVTENGATIYTNRLEIGTNETAKLLCVAALGNAFTFNVVKDGVTWPPPMVDGFVLAGPATISLGSQPRGVSDPAATALVTFKIEPESFPPDKTVILPEGTVGVVHVESSTNLVQWQDEWVQTFANTNQNRFFRIRAERTLP